ncbi:LigB family dioxygenase [Planctomycetes bacterium Poly30]|uniref:LigB family dioxygenase n=1 Tax=Saltatorellus ferox TaxID=2528018 RepID=A0A518EZQ9_9BACT|nr:LigB family dioxygenase [Planctomycetes bacterium Poly30]
MLVSPAALFVSHGAPTLAVEPERAADLREWGRSLEAPEAIVIVSAHWERTPVSIGTTTPRPLLHDYGGFRGPLQKVTYAAPVAADRADRVERALAASSLESGAVQRVDDRPWDHGVWVPLVHLFPESRVPVLQVSLASRTSPRRLFEIGQRLRRELGPDTLVIGSGGIVHNLRAIDWSETDLPPAWASDFEAWARDVLVRGDRDALMDFAARAPALHLAHPTLEHWLPMLVAAGAGGLGDTGSPGPRFPVEGFEYGSLGRLGVEFGASVD